MKKIIYSLLIFFSFFISVSAKEIQVNLFYSNTCPHCAAEKQFLNELINENNNVKVNLYEVTTSEENDKLLDLVKKSLNVNHNYVPYTVIGTIGLTGYNDSIKSQILHFVDKYQNEEYEDIVEKIKATNKVIDIKKDEELNKQNETEKQESNEKVNIPMIGDVDTKKVSLPIVSAVIGFVDGFNPCAMWILIFLLSMLIGMNNRKRMISLGLIFLTTSALVYMGIMMSWLEILKSIINESWMQYIIGIIAIIAALWNLYSYYKSTKNETGCEVVNKNSRKKIINRIKKFTNEKSFILAVIGVVALAISVNFIEFACSAGWPVIFTNILEINKLSSIESLIYISIYMFFFLIDDIIVFVVAMITFKITGISNKYSKYSHLIGGFLMLIIGLLMLFAPNILMFNF